MTVGIGTGARTLQLRDLAAPQPRSRALAWAGGWWWWDPCPCRRS